jgi:hypothetical protein
MSQITATVSSQPITATVNASGNISASVGSSVVTANAGGGIGPQGASGAAGGTLDQLSNVQIVSAQNGDLLRYNANKWTNVSETQVTDGGNA